MALLISKIMWLKVTGLQRFWKLNFSQTERKYRSVFCRVRALEKVAAQKSDHMHNRFEKQRLS